MKHELFVCSYWLTTSARLIGSLAFLHLLLFVILGASAWADQEVDLELPPPSSAEEIATPLELPFIKWPERPRITEWLRDQLNEAPPFLRDSKLNLHICSAVGAWRMAGV